MAAHTDDTYQFGPMDANVVQTHLDEFNCSLGSDGELDEMLNKMNALSTAYSITAMDFLDGLIAFMKNVKKTEVTMPILESYECQVLQTNRAEKRRGTKRPATMDIRKEREVLKEMPFYADLFAAVAPNNGAGDELSALDDPAEECEQQQKRAEFAAFDDDQNYAPRSKIGRETTTTSSLNITVPPNGTSAAAFFAWSTKSSFKGSAFVPTTAANCCCGKSATKMVPALRVVVNNECSDNGTCEKEEEDNELLDVENQPEWSGPNWLSESVYGLSLALSNLFSASSSSSSLLVGTICPTEGNCLSFQNVSLSTGTRSLPLDFENIDSISIYPGMEVMAKCTTFDDVHGDQQCQVQHVIEPPALQMPTVAAPVDQQQLTRLKVVVARGPFLNGMAHSDEQFVQLLDFVHTSHANALVLFGPFVPEGMELLTDSPEAIFSNLLAQINKHLTDQQHYVHVLIVPNAQCDQLNALPSFPTPPLDISQNGTVPNNVTFLPDPALFELESVHFAVSSSEILLHLCKTEICKSANVENEDRMRRLISHLFRARSLYPLCPCDQHLPFAPSSSARAKLSLPKRPHVMILPSLLQPVTKVVDGCVVINPGRFDRGKGSGTFSVLDLDLSRAACATSVSTFCEVSLFSTQQ